MKIRKKFGVFGLRVSRLVFGDYRWLTQRMSKYMMGCSCIVVQLTSRPLLLLMMLFFFLSFESNLLVSAAPSLRQIDFLFSNKVGTCRKYADAHLWRWWTLPALQSTFKYTFETSIDNKTSIIQSLSALRFVREANGLSSYHLLAVVFIVFETHKIRNGTAVISFCWTRERSKKKIENLLAKRKLNFCFRQLLSQGRGREIALCVRN